MSRTKKLTLADLLTAESNGFGYLGHSCRRPEHYVAAIRANPNFCPYNQIQWRDYAVVDAANRASMTVQEFQDFLNSKYGRWMGDLLSDPHAPAFGPKGTICEAIDQYVVKFRR